MEKILRLRSKTSERRLVLEAKNLGSEVQH